MTYGGAPALARTDPSSDGDKADRKRQKRAEKIRRDAERPPGAFERFRILMEAVDEGRKVVEIVDHKARYALVVMGILNAAVFFILSRAHLLEALPATGRLWLVVFLLGYGGLSFLFVLYAVDSLRPRLLRDTGLLQEGAPPAGAGGHGPAGLLYWEAVAGTDLDGYRRAWASTTMEQLNAEVVQVNHHLARLIQAKDQALGRLYLGLTALVVLGLIQLIGYAAMALTRVIRVIGP